MPTPARCVCGKAGGRGERAARTDVAGRQPGSLLLLQDPRHVGRGVGVAAGREREAARAGAGGKHGAWHAWRAAPAAWRPGGKQAFPAHTRQVACSHVAALTRRSCTSWAMRRLICARRAPLSARCRLSNSDSSRVPLETCRPGGEGWMEGEGGEGGGLGRSVTQSRLRRRPAVPRPRRRAGALDPGAQQLSLALTCASGNARCDWPRSTSSHLWVRSPAAPKG